MLSAAQWKRTVTPLLDPNTDYSFRRKLVYRTPTDWLLIGVHAEGSAFDRDRVYVSTVYMPLFVPQDHLVLSFGRRTWTAGPGGSDALLTGEVRCANSAG